MPGDRPRTTPSTPSRSPFRSPGVAALPLLSLALLCPARASQPNAAASDTPAAQMAVAEPATTIALATVAAAPATTPAPLPVAPPPPLEPALLAQEIGRAHV